MKTRLLPLLTLIASLSAPAQAAGDQQQRIPTVTRLVQLFSTLESELMAALQKGDTTAIDKMLADDFELRSGAMPGTPTPRAEWLRRSHGQAAAPIEQMAVHDYGSAAVVSYLWKRGARHDVFIVDVWGKSGDAWKLSARYASPAGDRRFTVPGAALESQPSEKK
ncbi:hypothetical protein SCT_1490 [Sulfuricella sp. T08]|uniref:nuclear transport factor 2 family protein n=1 Tax=Sulfuricella sp. T08 TaxID=1632857 RepID=UPI00061799D2|nr:nuclear transport factor 2 family protein [Sulfuricella sp. T08]GAO36091.1 hypothetical protein SCT_1490 [Sulfuricella sp. T08]